MRAIDGANSTQIGGDHYKNEYQHWDFVMDAQMGYFDGAASKYVSRWRKKSGIQDLQKARHFVVKMRELMTQGRMPQVTRQAVNAAHARKFCISNHLDTIETRVVTMLCLFQTVAGADEALDAIDQLIAECKAGITNPEGA